MVGILFTDSNIITHIRGPTSVEILRMHHIPDIYDQCISILFETALRLAFFRTLPSEVVRYLADFFVRDVLSNAFVPIYNCITSHPITTNFIWTLAYSDDKETSVILTNFNTKAPLDQKKWYFFRQAIDKY